LPYHGSSRGCKPYYLGSEVGVNHRAGDIRIAILLGLTFWHLRGLALLAAVLGLALHYWRRRRGILPYRQGYR